MQINTVLQQSFRRKRSGHRADCIGRAVMEAAKATFINRKTIPGMRIRSHHRGCRCAACAVTTAHIPFNLFGWLPLKVETDLPTSFLELRSFVSWELDKETFHALLELGIGAHADKLEDLS